MAFSEQKGQNTAEEDEDESFLIELLNARERRYDDGRPHRSSGTKGGERYSSFTGGSRTKRNGTGNGREDAKQGLEFPPWDDGGEYARAAEAAGVDVGGMLEAGVDAKQLLEFVSNYRKEEGEQLGLLDEHNLKFATSQVLRKEPRRGVEAVYTHAADSRSSGTPYASREGGGASRRTGENGLLYSRNGTRQTSRQGLPPDRRGREDGLPTERGGGRSRGARGRVLNRGEVLGEDDRAETARLCDELLRWSSALEGAERKLGVKGAAGAGRRTGGDGHRLNTTTRTPAEDIVENESEQTTSSVRDEQEQQQQQQDEEREDSCSEGRFVTTQGKANGSGKPHLSPAEPRRKVRRRSRRQGAIEVSGGRDRSSSLENTTEWDSEEGEAVLASSPARHGGGVGVNVVGNGHARPIPSYALPTKHFKTLDRDRRDALVVEDAHRKKQQQRQAFLEEENGALKLRLEGQRRAIHELEHQANSLREEARIRQGEMLRLKRKVATTPFPSTGGKCSCGASTHQGRSRFAGDNGASTLKKRALAAEAHARGLETRLSESKAKEQRSREIVASLKHSYSDAQAKVASLEAEVDSAKTALLEARRELADSRRDAKARMKDSRKHRRQEGERTRETEIARAEAADLAVRLRKACKDAERARLDAVDARQEKERAEVRAKDLLRENQMLQDRLNDGQLRRRVRERDRWILSELRSESMSPTRRSAAHAVSGGSQGRNAERLSSHRDPPEATSHTNLRRPRLADGPNDGAWARARSDGRRRRLGEAGLDSTSGSESPVRRRSPPVSSTRGALGTRGGSDGRARGADGRPPPAKEGRPRVNTSGGSPGWEVNEAPGAWGGTGRLLSTRSADGAEEGFVSNGAILQSGAPSVGSAHSTMGARYERLQAMYRRVNRRDAGSRGRAGVG